MDTITVIIVLAIIVYIAFIIRLIISIIISYDNNNPVRTIAWILTVILLPLIGVLLYVLFGRNLHKKRSYFRKLNKKVKEKGAPYFNFEKEESELVEKYERLKNLLSAPLYLPVFPGNKIDLFAHGREKFAALFPDLEAAKHHIHILYYTIGDDVIGNKFKDTLIRKRREGVEVRLMYDEVGCNKVPKKYFKEMKEVGIEVVVFSPVRFRRLLKTINYRNHKKIVVIDGRIGYTGGINVKDEYIKGVDWGIWKDVHLRMEGPGTQGLQTLFFIDWFYESNKYLMDNPEYYPRLEHAGDNFLQTISAEPVGKFDHIMMGMVEAIMQAKKSVYIESPYFVPTDTFLDAVQIVGLSQVEIHLVMPEKSDNPMVQYASNSYVQQILDANVIVHRYEAGFIHSKLIVVDDELVIAGSSNLDIRSFELNFENNVFIYNKETALKAKKIILDDISNSKTVDSVQWMQRPRKAKFKESFYRLLSPLM